MASRKTYWVRYVKVTDNWAVKHDTTTLSTHILKSTAVDAGVKVAKANAPSSLKICRKDNTIEDERTYEADPYPPQG